MFKKWFILLLFCVLTGIISCSGVRVQLPDGFAQGSSRKYYSAISPEGMRYRVRTVRNYPHKELDFWNEALKNHLLDEGYRLLDSGEDFSTPTAQGTLYEWVVPYGSGDYIFLTAIIPAGKRVLIAEAAGEYTIYSRYRESIHDSLETLSLRFRPFQ
jgi:hypothetical protein